METHIGLDSQCLSYLIDAASGVLEPTDDLAEQRKALIRIWFYDRGRFYITETVASECASIRNVDRRELHEAFSVNSFWGMPVRDSAKVSARVAELMRKHSKKRDCKILAEAEDLELDILLSYDEAFVRRLAIASQTIKLMKPKEYWDTLGIPQGAKPESVPHQTNPLSQQTWWRV